MASPYLETSPLGKNEEGKAQDGTWAGEENRELLLRKHLQEQKDSENSIKEKEERKTT